MNTQLLFESRTVIIVNLWNAQLTILEQMISNEFGDREGR